MKLDHILAIADRDDPRQLAVRAALDLLPAATGRLRVVGFAYEPAAAEPGVLSATAAAALQRALLADKRRWLKRHLAALLPGGGSRIEAVWAADLVDWVVEAVPREGIDLVVKAGHRSETLFYTPTDWQLLRRCPVPVLIAGPRPRSRRNRCILAAIDAGSTDPVQTALNRKVLAAAADLGALLGARVHAAHVVAVSTVARDLDLVDLDALERRARAKLGPMLAALAGEHGIPAENVVVKAGPPDRLLPRIAARLGADIVVMGTVGRTGAAGKLLGNTAERVLHRLRTSLLAVRPG